MGILRTMPELRSATSLNLYSAELLYYLTDLRWRQLVVIRQPSRHVACGCTESVFERTIEAHRDNVRWSFHAALPQACSGYDVHGELYGSWRLFEGVKRH